ncbi:YbgA family protein [Candidatus Latescibacterota bacterium]
MKKLCPLSGDTAMETINIGVSACLLGERVRYDGTYKLDRYLVETLSKYFRYMPVCPEVECGLPVPREVMWLSGDPVYPRLVTIQTGIDHTERLQMWGREKLRVLEHEDIWGFILKSRSPSCGVAKVTVHRGRGSSPACGAGIWARMIMDRFPLIPVEGDDRLSKPEIREHFIERIFVFKRWRELIRGGMKADRLVDFHTRHELLFRAHNPQVGRELGRLVEVGKIIDANELFDRYLALLTKALALKSTVRKNADVLIHLMRFFKRILAADEKAELLDIIECYRTGQVPLIMPVTLVNHYVRKFNEPYLSNQYYLNPHPLELKLRSFG